MTTLAIIHYSHTGGARQLAEAAGAAALETGDVTVRVIDARQAASGDVLGADGLIFACPENLAAIAGEMKAFFDRTYYDVLGQVEGRPYAAMVCAGSDGHNAARQLDRIATGWRLRRIADTLIVNVGAQTQEQILAPKHLTQAQLAPAREMGGAMAAGLALGVF